MPEEIEIKQAEQKKIDEQKKLEEKKRKLMNKDDTSNSKYAKDFLSQKDPTCRNYTFSEIYGSSTPSSLLNFSISFSVLLVFGMIIIPLSMRDFIYFLI